MDPALAELLRAEEAAEDRVIEAIIRFRRPGAEVPGARIVARFGGEVATCRVALSEVRSVREHWETLSLKAARTLGADLRRGATGDRGRPNDVRRPPGLPLTGAGVVVGVVDWGVDFDHPSFKNADGTTRLLALWDQRASASGLAPVPYGYGTVHTRRRIDQALRTSEPYADLGYHPGATDRASAGMHGTHVMDIAAGNGRAGGPAGVAPEADLVFVHLADSGTGGLANLGDSVRLLEAVDFVRRTAAERPWVVNVSVGRMGGPHDGETPVEIAFDELLAAAPGRFIAQSAGNYHRSGTHASGVLEQGESRTLTFVTDPADRSPNELEVWYDGADELVVRVDPPGGRGPAVPLGARGELTAGDEVVGHVYHRALDPNNGDNHVDAFLLPRAGTWTVTLEAKRVTSGCFDAWLERDEACGTCQARFTAGDADPASTTGTIANGRLPLVVGAYDAHEPDRPPAAFTSRGPTRDHRCKPDVAGPGKDILAAQSAPRGSRQSPGGAVRKSGSSMATPHVTGAVALCLEAGGHRLAAQRIRALVLDTAELPAAPDRAGLGRGYLDLQSLVTAVRTEFPVPPASDTKKDGAMEPDVDTITGLALAPARAYRELLYRSGGHLAGALDRRFAVLARPGERMSEPPRAGDVVVSVRLGRATGGTCAVLTGSELVRRRASGPHGAAGWYMAATDAAAPDGPLELRLLDTEGCVSPGRLVLRPRVAEDLGAEHEFDELDELDAERTPVPVDALTAVPPFGATERANVATPLLTAKQLEKAIAWSARVHPATSGVTLDEIRGALDSYVDEAAVRTAMGTAGANADAVLMERVHQFQVKCYVDTSEHDGQAGESTLDSLGLVARTGSGMHQADRGHAGAQQRLSSRDARVKAATGNEFSAANWFDRMVDPSIFGLRTKLGNGLHVVLVRKLRQAERHLLTLPAFAGRTPVGLASALGITEKHGGARPSQTQSTSVHTFGLAIDIAYTANPWVRRAASWAALQRAALLVSGTSLTQRSAPAYFSSLGTDPALTTGQVWDAVQQRNAELVAYMALSNDDAALGAAIVTGQTRGTAGLTKPGETLADSIRRWKTRIQQDRRALAAGDFDNHLAPDRGFLSHHRDLVIALRDHACLAWGAVDLGAGDLGSGDIMHFDGRVDGAGRVLSENTQAHVPTRGHPCLPRPATAPAAAASEADAETVASAKRTIRAQSAHWGTDEAAITNELRALVPSDMAELAADGAIVDVLNGELSGNELAAAGAQLARGRVSSMTRVDVDRVIAAPARHAFGTYAAALTRGVLLGHQEAFDRTGTGTIHGSHCPAPKPGGTTTSDCTEYVKDVLKRAFTAKGAGATWTDVLRDATTASGSAGLKGTEVIRALQAKLGWEAVFWAPDTVDPFDGDSEHPYAYRVMRRRGTYYGITVDIAKSVVNYRRTKPASPTDTSGLERLKRLQFGVLAARGGTHMALIVNGDVYEVHWSLGATDRNAVEATPLSTFDWLSGAIAAPKGDLALAWRTP